ncbi:hypothetical protein [Streptomyces sp. NPDC051079]|uniref:hypothetical protein n=1 Tax=Streptomyces sp. NPDC051079 TaxID=3155043 RepID=UPI00344FE763
MRPALWLLFTISTAAAVYVSTCADYTGTTRVLASVASGVVFVGSSLGLWLTDSKE